MKPLLLNFAIALLWPLLTAEFTGARFLAGFLIGFGLLALFRPVLDSGSYVRRSLAVLVFLGVFLQQYLVTSLRTLRTTLFTPRARLQPAFVRYDVAGLSRLERLVLAQAISLTPGTTVLEDEPRHLLLHALDGHDPAAVQTSIDRTVRRALVAFTR